MIRLISLLPIPKFINEQPEWWTDMSVDQQKQYLSTYKKSKHKIVPQNPSGKEERGKNVVKTKPYSRQQAQDETGEYFENDVAYEAMPNLAKDEDDLVQKIQDGFLDFDRVIASPDMMGSVSKVAKILGPKGLMPNPKMGTVTPNIGEAVKLVKSGQVQFKAEKNGIVQAGIAKSNFGAKNIIENINSFVDTIKKSKPSGAKGTFIKKISLSSTMGVSVNCEIN